MYCPPSSFSSEGNAGAPLAARQKGAALIAERMGSTSASGGRGFAIGSNDVTAPQIEQSFLEILACLEVHLSAFPFLFGATPSFGDFGLGLQLFHGLTPLLHGQAVLLPTTRRAGSSPLQP